MVALHLVSVNARDHRRVVQKRSVSLSLLAKIAISLIIGSMSSIKRYVKKKSLPTTGAEIVSRHPAHLKYASVRAVVVFHSHKIFPLWMTTRSSLGRAASHWC